ncbi:MAG: hypothetical protein ACI4PM_00685 [Butyricicoccus sp.]
MYRGTTPQHVFELPDELADVAFDALYITYSQFGVTKIEKALNDVTRDGSKLTVHLTQEETLQLVASAQPVHIQIRLRTADGTAMASNVVLAPVKSVLKEGVI